MNKKSSLCLFIIITLVSLLNVSCSSVFTGTVSGDVKYATKDNPTSDDKSELEGATVYVFFDSTEWNTTKNKWTLKSRSVSGDSTEVERLMLPQNSKTISSANTNSQGKFSIKTMWTSNAPLFGKTGDRVRFHVAVYHKDYGMIFDDQEYSLLSDSAQNINVAFPYNKYMATYSVVLNMKNYSDQNSDISISEVNPKVTFYLAASDGSNDDLDLTKGGTSISSTSWDKLPTTSTPAGQVSTDSVVYRFTADKYKFVNGSYTNERIYPVVKVKVDMGNDEVREYFQCTEDGTYIENNENGTSTSLPKIVFSSKSEKENCDVYVDSAKREYSLGFNLKDYKSKNNKTSLNNFAPYVKLVATLNGKKSTFTYSTSDVPSDGYYKFKLTRYFDDGSHSKEIFPQVTYSLTDDKDDLEYIQVDENGTAYQEGQGPTTEYKENVYSKKEDVYLKDAQRTYSLSFNFKNYKDESTVTNLQDFAPNVDLIVYMNNVEKNTYSYERDDLPTEGKFTFKLDREYDSSNNEIFPTVKFRFTDNPSDVEYVQVKKDGTIYSSLDDSTKKDYQEASYPVNTTSITEDVFMAYAKRSYTIKFNLKNLEDDSDYSEGTFASFNPQTTLTYYYLNNGSKENIDSVIYNDASSNGSYSFDWKHGLDGVSDADNEKAPTVEYYLKDKRAEADYLQTDKEGNLIKKQDNEPVLTCDSEHTTNDDVDVYLAKTKRTYYLDLDLRNVASNNSIDLRAMNPKTEISAVIKDDDGANLEEKKIVKNSIPTDGTYSIEMKRYFKNPNALKGEEFYPELTLVLTDTRGDVRYRQCNEAGSVGALKTSPTKYSFDNKDKSTAKVYIKDYQIDDFNFDGQFVTSPSADANYHKVWIVEGNDLNQVDNSDIKAYATTSKKVITGTDAQIKDGCFDTTIKNSNLLTTDEYTDDMKVYSKSYIVVVNQLTVNNEMQNGDYGTVVKKDNSGNTEPQILVYKDATTEITLK